MFSSYFMLVRGEFNISPLASNVPLFFRGNVGANVFVF